jgi:3-mercaptopyruvate sulfurtransferase SseA
MNEASGARAAQQLIHAGIASVKVLRGGLEGWEKAGYPIESANVTESPPRIAEKRRA